MTREPSNFPTDPGHERPVRDKRNVGLWAGLGCLGTLILSCCLLSYWAQTFGLRWVLSQSDETKSWASRMVLTGALRGIRDTCTDGAVSEDVERWFHQSLSTEARNRLCGIDDATIEAIATPERVPAQTLASAGASEVAERAGMDPTLCYRYTTDRLEIIGCFDSDPEPRDVPYKLVDVRARP